MKKILIIHGPNLNLLGMREKSIYGEKPFDAGEIYDTCLGYFKVIEKFLGKASLLVSEARKKDKKILFEGAQGTGLDVDHGTYPYVTSSNVVAAQACIGSGVGPNAIDKVAGIFQAYVTRVGGGPFPTELPGDQAEEIRKKGNEYGATTGRPRRCGWLDLVLLRQAIRLNGIESLCMNKLDVLCGLEKVKICNSYRLDGDILKDSDFLTGDLLRVEPTYTEFDGWEKIETGKVKRKKDLSKNALIFLEFIESETATPVDLISLGPSREETLVVRELL